MTRFSFDLEDDATKFSATDWFSLENTVGLGRSNNRHDIYKVESLLANTGDLDTSHTDGPTGFGLYTVDEAVRKFQDRNGLKVDGWLRPDGPTIGKLKEQLGSTLAGYLAPSIEQLEAHRAAVQKGEPGLLNMKLPDVSLKPISIVPDQKTHGSNESWVNWLAQNRGGFDEAPAMLATYIKNFGMEGVANARDFVAQWDAQKPGDGKNAIRAILSHLPDDATRRAFVGGELPPGPPIGTLKPEAVPQMLEADDEPLVERNWIYNPETGMARLADDQPQTIQVAQARTTMTDAVNDGALQGDEPPPQVAQATTTSRAPSILPPRAPLSQSPTPIGSDQNAPPPELPENKTKLLGNQAGRERYAVFERALDALPDKGSNEAAVYRDMYVQEGGDWINAANRSSTGLTNTELAKIIDKGMLPGIAPGTKSEDLPTDRKPEAIRGYFDLALPHAGGHKAIAAIEDQQTATAFGAAIVMHGGTQGSRAIQRSIIAATGEPSDPRDQEAFTDGKMGGITIGRLNTVAADPEKKAAFLNALADERIAMLKTLRESRNENVAAGEIENINRHRPK